MRIKMYRLLIILFLSFPVHANQIQIKGKVIEVINGNTIILQKSDSTRKEIKLSGIEVPENSRIYTKKSKKFLASMIENQDVIVTFENHHKHKTKFFNITGKVLFNHVDINLKMLKHGYVLHAKKDHKEQLQSDAILYSKAEDRARFKQIGLFSDKAFTQRKVNENYINTSHLSSCDYIQIKKEQIEELARKGYKASEARSVRERKKYWSNLHNACS